MKRLIAAAAVAGVVWLAPMVASAHHPVVVAGEVTCLSDGSYSIGWTVTADAVRGKEWKLTSPVATDWRPDSESITYTTTAPGTATSASTVAVASWRPDGPTGQTRSGTVRLAGTCIPTTTTTSTSTTSTTTSTTSTTVPPTTSTTPPTWTVPEGCVVGEFDVVCTEPPADTTVPPVPSTPATTVPRGCPSGEFPQGPIGDEPCGPTDLCSGDGSTRNWTYAPCDTTSLADPATSVSPPALPATGGETGWIALVALVTVLTGISVVSVTRRSS